MSLHKSKTSDAVSSAVIVAVVFVVIGVIMFWSGAVFSNNARPLHTVGSAITNVSRP